MLDIDDARKRVAAYDEGEGPTCWLAGIAEDALDEVEALQRAVSALSTAYEMARAAQDKPAAHIITEAMNEQV